MVREYLSTKDLCQRFRCSSRTIFRRMAREDNPFPQPLIRQAGSFNLWCADAVSKWEDREIKRSENSRWGGIKASPPATIQPPPKPSTELPAKRWH